MLDLLWKDQKGSQACYLWTEHNYVWNYVPKLKIGPYLFHLKVLYVLLPSFLLHIAFQNAEYLFATAFMQLEKRFEIDSRVQ